MRGSSILWGLITLAAYLPHDWELRLVDLNIVSLDDEVLRWVDVVLMGGMVIQRDAMHDVIDRAHHFDGEILLERVVYRLRVRYPSAAYRRRGVEDGAGATARSRRVIARRRGTRSLSYLTPVQTVRGHI